MYTAYYAYAYPEPPGFNAVKLKPGNAFYSKELSEFILPYKAVRTLDKPDEQLISFLQSTYEAAADLGKWDRSSLEQKKVNSLGR